MHFYRIHAYFIPEGNVGRTLPWSYFRRILTYVITIPQCYGQRGGNRGLAVAVGEIAYRPKWCHLKSRPTMSIQNQTFTQSQLLGTYKRTISNRAMTGEVRQTQHNNVKMWKVKNEACSIIRHVDCQRRIQSNTSDIYKYSFNWIGLSSVSRPRQHSIGFMGGVLKEQIAHRQIRHTISRHEHKTQQVP